ncbi:E3 ubiquitin-protein ligase MIB2, partial [Biomphalaria glabrata]
MTFDDGGEGGVGTMVQLHEEAGSTLPEKCVMLKWDVREKRQYRGGGGDAYDLSIFNNATE